MISRDHSVYATSQWETVLQCNAISHWLDAYTEWSLISLLSIVAANYLEQILNVMVLVLHLEQFQPVIQFGGNICWYIRHSAYIIAMAEAQVYGKLYKLAIKLLSLSPRLTFF